MNVKKNLDMLELKETSRTYFFPNGREFTINNAVKCVINKKNTHQLMTKQGEIFTVPYTWLVMKYIPIVKDKESRK